MHRPLMLARWTPQRVAQQRVWRLPLPIGSPRQLQGHRIHSLTKKRTSIYKNDSTTTRLNRIHQSRSIFTTITTTVPPIFLPPVIFIGLLLALWTWKCFWIIVMQNKLLYLSWLPPFSRSEKISDYERECKPVQWTEKRIRSLDGTKLAICEGRLPDDHEHLKKAIPSGKKKKSVVICYFQGNGGSTPLRLPLLSQVLSSIKTMSKSTSTSSDETTSTSHTIVALSYRGYWTSSGRATQSGIELDAQAFLNWVSETYSTPDSDLQIVLWGHSLGSSVASTALATYLSRQKDNDGGGEGSLPISGLVMEAPTSNIKDMLISLYPQKWLPYRYLWPFSWNTWCNATALERIAGYRDEKNRQMEKNDGDGASESGAGSVPPIFILSAEKDEVIPPYVAGQLEKRGRDLGLDIERKDVLGAMHTEAPMKLDGREALVRFILRTSST